MNKILNFVKNCQL